MNAMFSVTIEHPGRELLHAIDLLGRCLLIPRVKAATRRRWEHEIHKAQGGPGSPVRGGLRRDFLSPRAS